MIFPVLEMTTVCTSGISTVARLVLTLPGWIGGTIPTGTAHANDVRHLGMCPTNGLYMNNRHILNLWFLESGQELTLIEGEKEVLEINN